MMNRTADENAPLGNCRSDLDLHRENPCDGFADFGAVNAAERERQLCLHQAVGNSGIVSLALGYNAPVFVAMLSHVLLGSGKLKFVFLPDVVFDEVFE
jgi:hypothetical protein